MSRMTVFAAPQAQGPVAAPPEWQGRWHLRHLGGGARQRRQEGLRVHLQVQQQRCRLFSGTGPRTA